MIVEFTQVDVFADEAYTGNPLAVFHDASELDARQMQAIARELSLSETSFVLSTGHESFEARIFTPNSELPFAGHPTLGAAWVLLEKGLIKGDALEQRTSAGETKISVEGEVLWLERPGASDDDVEAADTTAAADIAGALRIDMSAVGLEARELGRSGFLRPAFADGGLRQLVVPVRDEATLRRCVPPVGMRTSEWGAFCFTAVGAGRIKARGLWPGLGISEDPATGSGAVNLGLYLAQRLGDIELEVVQGEQIERPSRMLVRARPGTVRVGGRCTKISEARLLALP